jgi:serine/threonine protein kinase
MEYKSGDRICGCTLRQKSGHGAYGEVWIADMDATGARVAVKIISNQGRYSERELAGLRNYKDCSHPNLLNIRFVEITGERICCIMDAADDLNHGQGEYLADTLANRLNKFGRLDGKEITAMLDGLLAGLEELHRHELVHRDIKPDNILWVNGRPTLADVGLIALDGKGSLVGTPGFMSPKLLSGQGQADASDDFYALGKVIYCALTGLPVSEYPSIPENMTISLDASLGRAFRESCKHPVRSSAEFRKLLEKKTGPDAPKGNDVRMTVQTESNPWLGKILLLLVLLFLLSVGLLFLYKKSVRETQAIPKPAPAVSAKSNEEAELDAKLNEVRAQAAEAQAKVRAQSKKFNIRIHGAAGADYLEEIQKRTVKFFRENGILPGTGKWASLLINYQVMDGKEIQSVIVTSNRNPRLVPTAGVHPRRSPHYGITKTEQRLQFLFSVAYPDFDLQNVKSHQKFWREHPGTADQIQRQMLESDPVMQALALDAMIRAKVNTILKNGIFQPGEKSQLGTLFELRHGLIQPERGKPSFLQWFAE